MYETTSVTREQIESLIRRIFEIENGRPTKTVDETIAGIDSLMASAVEGWTNGKHCPNRSVEREFEREFTSTTLHRGSCLFPYSRSPHFPSVNLFRFPLKESYNLWAGGGTTSCLTESDSSCCFRRC
jgi:hypothetical protein